MKLKAIPYIISALAAVSISQVNALTTGGPGNDTVIPSTGPTGTVTVAGNATVNGTLRVQPAPSPVTVTANNTNAGQVNPAPGGATPTSTPIRTILGGTAATYTDATGGGAEIQNDGDTTLSSSTGEDNVVTTQRVSEVQVYNADQGALAGQPVPGTQRYYLIDANGNEIAGTEVTEAAEGSAAAAQIKFAESVDGDGTDDYDFTAANFDGARTSTPLEDTGGNLTVGGQTTTNGIENSGNKITGVAAGEADTDAVNKGQMDAADTGLQGNIDTEAATRAADDATLQGNIDAEAATRAADDATLQGNIDAEAATRAADDATLQGNIDAEAATRAADDAAEAATRAADDATLQGNIDTEAATRADADATLQGNIDQEVADRSELISSAGLNADGNQIVHIGDNSLITQELGGQQLLSAQDGLANPIDINVTNGSDLLVNGLSVATDVDVTNAVAAEALIRSTEDLDIRADFAAADTILDGKITTEKTERIAEDLDIRADFAAADTVLDGKITTERNARIAEDLDIRNDFAAADADIRDEFRSADRGLRNDIDKNTRGIAMVAAMTNTTVEQGKTHGVDFNISQFESSTGFSFGYANRINDCVQLHAAVASSDDFEEAVGRIGVSIQW